MMRKTTDDSNQPFLSPIASPRHPPINDSLAMGDVKISRVYESIDDCLIEDVLPPQMNNNGNGDGDEPSSANQGTLYTLHFALFLAI